MAVQILQANLKEIAKRLPSEAMARTAASRAINRALQSGRTQAARELAKEYAIRQRQVNNKVKISKATPSNLSAGVTWRGYALNLADFRTNPNKAPQKGKKVVLRATIARAAGMQSFGGAFLISTRAGVKAFRRTSGAEASKTSYPITGVWGPAIPQLLGAKNVRDAVESRAQSVLTLRLEHEIDRMLAK